MLDIDSSREQKEDIYSNFSAAVMLGNPETKPTISHGWSFARDVRAAPPFARPLCWLKRRGGFGVDPMYSDACRIVERRIYTVYSAGIGLD